MIFGGSRSVECSTQGGKSAACEGVGLEPCARRDKMAPAAPSVAAAMMGLGEGVAAPSPSTSLPVSRSFCVVFPSLGRTEEALWLRLYHFLAWERSTLAVGEGFASENRRARALGAERGERSGPPHFWVMQLSLLYYFTSRVLASSCVYCCLLASFLWLTSL